MAQMAVRWAPGDPLTLATGVVRAKPLALRTWPRLCANTSWRSRHRLRDYRYWMELGRRFEAAGDPDRGEKALRRAVELAPAHSHPRWHYGNLLPAPRENRRSICAVIEAAEADELMQAPIFGLATQVFGGDVEKIIRCCPRRSAFAIRDQPDQYG